MQSGAKLREFGRTFVYRLRCGIGRKLRYRFPRRFSNRRNASRRWTVPTSQFSHRIIGHTYSNITMRRAGKDWSLNYESVSARKANASFKLLQTTRLGEIFVLIMSYNYSKSVYINCICLRNQSVVYRLLFPEKADESFTI